jgi:peptidoglycan/xylan/chitin deacetylase (PgdA/CDA1 family)
VLFTFDDGGVSAHPVIAPRLEHRGWLAHILVTTDRIGTSGFLTSAQIKDLHRRGHVIGSHSASHPVRMSHCTPDELRREWTTSVAVLSDLVGSPVDVASVPGGYLSDDVVRAAASAGIRYLFTSEPESRVRVVDGCQVFGRFTLRRSSSPAAAALLVSRNPVGRFNQWAAWGAKKVVKRVGGRLYLRARSALLDRGDNSESTPTREERP